MNIALSIESGYLALGGLVTLGFGVAYLVATRAMARMVGIDAPTPAARADYRAIYAGSQIGLGVFFLAAAAQPEWLRPGLWALALFAGGFGLVRLGSLAADRAGRDPQWVVAPLELLAGLLAAWLAVRA